MLSRRETPPPWERLVDREASVLVEREESFAKLNFTWITRRAFDHGELHEINHVVEVQFVSTKTAKILFLQESITVRDHVGWVDEMGFHGEFFWVSCCVVRHDVLLKTPIGEGLNFSRGNICRITTCRFWGGENSLRLNGLIPTVSLSGKHARSDSSQPGLFCSAGCGAGGRADGGPGDSRNWSSALLPRLQ